MEPGLSSGGGLHGILRLGEPKLHQQFECRQPNRRSASKFVLLYLLYCHCGLHKRWHPERLVAGIGHLPTHGVCRFGWRHCAEREFFPGPGVSQTFTITPSTGYTIANVQVDGKSVGATSSYTLTGISGPHSITAAFVPNSDYTITATAGPNGSISPSGSVPVYPKGSSTFTITPNTGYSVSNVVIDGKSVGAVTSYTFSSVTANHTISATFAIKTYTITASAGTGGSISPSGAQTVNYNTNQGFTITPNTGYTISNVVVDGKSAGAVTSYSFSSVTANHTISATFAINTYTITASAGTGGSISPSGAQTVNYNTNQGFTITPNTGYSVSNVVVDGKNAGAVTSYSFSSVTANHAISATFAIKTYTITASAGTGGSISPSGTRNVNYGTSQTYAIAPAAGYRAAGVTADGVSVGAITKYTFSNIQANHTITASFVTLSKATDDQPVADAGPDQTVAAESVVTLDGSNSTDAGGLGITSFKWTQVGGTTVTLSNADAAQTTFTAPAGQGALLFQLTTTTMGGNKSSATCVVNAVTNARPPQADAGPDQTLKIEPLVTMVTLDGSQSSDLKGHISSYLWQQLDGPAVTLINSESSSARFLAPRVGSGSVSLSFMLTVTDNFGLKSTDICYVNITETDSPPQAAVAASQKAVAGNVVQLDGSSSTASSDITSFRWHQMAGAPVNLIPDPTTPVTTFIAVDGGQYGISPPSD